MHGAAAANWLKLISPPKLYEIFETNYWTLTNFLHVAEEAGKQYEKTQDEEEVIVKIKSKYDINTEVRCIFTDGSKSEEGKATGSAFFDSEESMGYMISLNKKASIFTAEACAVAKSLQWIIEQRLTDNIIILTDSLSVIKNLQNNDLNIYTNLFITEIRRHVDELKDMHTRKGKKVIFAWIPAHKGIWGNDQADTLAKEARDDNHTELIEVPLTDYRRINKEEMYNRTIKEIKYQFEFKGKQYYNKFFDGNSKHPWFEDTNLPRRTIVTINRLRANHNLNESLARVGYVDSPECECGYEKEDINHYVLHCNKYTEERKELKSNLIRIGASRPYCVWS